MAPKQHARLTTKETADLNAGMIWTVAVLLLAVAATFGLRATVSIDALAPLVTTVLFGLAAMVAVVSLLLRRYDLRIGVADIAGILTFIGVGVSIAIEPDQMVRLMTRPDQTD